MRERERRNPTPWEITVNGQHYSPSTPCLPAAHSQVPAGTVGAFLCAAKQGRLSCARLYPPIPQTGQKAKGASEEVCLSGWKKKERRCAGLIEKKKIKVGAKVRLNVTKITQIHGVSEFKVWVVAWKLLCSNNSMVSDRSFFFKFNHNEFHLFLSWGL